MAYDTSLDGRESLLFLPFLPTVAPCAGGRSPSNTAGPRGGESDFPSRLKQKTAVTKEGKLEGEMRNVRRKRDREV
jgi:hypothetical protein